MGKLLEHKGKLYEQGKYYMFIDAPGYESRCDALIHIDSNHRLPFLLESGYRYLMCAEMSHAVGLVTDKPFEPVKGKLYEFSDYNQRWFLGVFRETGEGGKFITALGARWNYCQAIPVNNRPEWGE